MKQVKEYIKDYIAQNKLDKDLFYSKSRKRELVFHRLILSNILRKVFNLGLQQCGDLLNRDHSSVLYHLKEYETLSSIYPDYVNAYRTAEFLAQSYIDEKDKTADIVQRLLLSNNALRGKLKDRIELLTDARKQIEHLNIKIEDLKQEVKNLKYNYV